MIKNRYGIDIEIPEHKCSLNRYGVEIFNCQNKAIKINFIEKIIAKIIKFISK